MPANNDSSCTQTYYTAGIIKKVVFDITFDSGDGSFANTDLTTKFEGYLLMLEVNPGSPAPTDNYDIDLYDAEGKKVTGTLGKNRDTSNSEVVALHRENYFHRTINTTDTLTLTIGGNSVASATTKIILYWSVASG